MTLQSDRVPGQWLDTILAFVAVLLLIFAADHYVTEYREFQEANYMAEFEPPPER